MMDCKIAIQEAQAKGFTGTASLTEAMKILKIKGKQIAEQKKQAKTEEGLISAYIHHDGKIGALVEINCQTDFVARTDEFQTICKDIAMQVAATAPEYISIEDVPQEVKEEKFKEYKEEALRLNKPEHISDKIAENKLKDFYSQVCLLEQAFIKDERLK
jgi:elongation factor Ts